MNVKYFEYDNYFRNAPLKKLACDQNWQIFTMTGPEQWQTGRELINPKLWWLNPAF